MKKRLAKWFFVVVLLLAVAVGCTLWQRVNARVKKLLLPENPLLVGYTDLPDKTQGVQLTPFEIIGWDGTPVQACKVHCTAGKDEMTPRQLTTLDLLAKAKPNELSGIDYALVCVDWDHGIRSALPLAEQLAAAGIKCVLWEPRGKNSSRPWCTHGLHESRDIPLLIQALEKEAGRKDMIIAGVGQGFGAGLMLQAAAVEPRLRAVVAINPSSSLNKILKRAQVNAPMRELIGWRMSQLTGLEPFDIAAVKSAAAIDREVPVLIIYRQEEETASSSQDDAVAIYTQLKSDGKRLLATRSEKDAPDATTRTVIYSPEGGSREILQEVEAELIDNEEEIPVEALLWLTEQVPAMQEHPLPATTPTPDR